MRQSKKYAWSYFEHVSSVVLLWKACDGLIRQLITQTQLPVIAKHGESKEMRAEQEYYLHNTTKQTIPSHPDHDATGIDT